MSLLMLYVLTVGPRSDASRHLPSTINSESGPAKDILSRTSSLPLSVRARLRLRYDYNYYSLPLLLIKKDISAFSLRVRLLFLAIAHAPEHLSQCLICSS